MKLIAAVDEKWGIGKNGGLLASIPEDMRFFREKTRGRVLVMGRGTLDSFPGGRPLPGRLNIVISRSAQTRTDGVVVCNSTEQLFELLQGFSTDDVFVIGGGSVYRQLLPYCDTAYITRMCFDGGAEVFMPNLDETEGWIRSDCGDRQEHDGLRFAFTTYTNPKAPQTGFSGKCGSMAEYFKPKKEIEIEVLSLTGDRGKEYLTKLRELLRAYFKPLEGGFSAEDAKAFLEEQKARGCTLEDYLLKNKLIARQSDFAGLNSAFDNGKDLPVKTLSVTKEQADDINDIILDYN